MGFRSDRNQQRRALFPRGDRDRSTQIGYVTADRSSRIGCTTDLPHQDNQKKVKPHLKEWPAPSLHVLVCDCGPSLEQIGKRRFCSCQHDVDKKVNPRHSGQVFNQRHQRGETRNKASCFNLLKMNSQVKSVNSEVRSVSSLPTGFPQMGPWHHVGATMEITLDKNWSFIGSGGNWIPCMQNQTRPRTKESLMKYPSEIPCRKMRKVERRPDRRISIQSSAFWNCLMSSNWGPNNRKNSRQIAKTVQSSKISKRIPIRFSA